MRISAVLRIAITLLLFLGCMESQVASPKDVVQQFVNLDVLKVGRRLTRSLPSTPNRLYQRSSW